MFYERLGSFLHWFLRHPASGVSRADVVDGLERMAQFLRDEDDEEKA